MCGYRKYTCTYTHHRGNWKLQRGSGVKDPGNYCGEGDWMVDLVDHVLDLKYGVNFIHTHQFVKGNCATFTKGLNRLGR